MDPRKWTWDRWVAFAAVAIPMVTGAGWYVEVLGAEAAAIVTGVSSTVVGLLKLIQEMAAAPAPAEPPVA